MKPLDSNDDAMSVPESEAAESASARVAPSGFAPSDEAVVTPRSQSDIVAAFQNRSDGASAPARVSRVVPLGTAAEESVNEAAEPADAVSMRPSDVVPRDNGPRDNGPRELTPHENRAAVRVAELGLTRQGPSFTADEDDEATTVDATAGLSFEQREALGARVHSNLEETQPHGTPPPARVVDAGAVEARAVEVRAVEVRSVEARSVDEMEVARDRRNVFRQTMLLGLPTRETPAPAPAVAPAVGAEPALLASAVRVVGPPTQPPPRRSRRLGPIPSAPQGEAEHPEHHEHEAFALMNAIVTPERSKRVVPDAAPPPAMPSPTVHPSEAQYSDMPPSSALPAAGRSFAAAASAPSLSVSVSRASRPGVMLPPAPSPRDYELDSSPLHSKTSPPLRATIDSPSSRARTLPPGARRMVEGQLDELPVSGDPFAGFVAPPPSPLQRWLVVIVVALAVVGLCSLAAIALGFLGKTGW